MAASVVAGGRLLGGADDTIEVWVAAADLAEGQPLTEADLAARRVRFDHDADAGRYLVVGTELPADATLSRPVGDGELVPQAALGAPADDLLEVPIWAPSDAIPASVRAGSTVDVWVTPGSGERASARLVLDDVVVIAAPRADESFSPTGNRQVLVGVRDGDDRGIGLALAAAKDDRVAIIRQG